MSARNEDHQRLCVGFGAVTGREQKRPGFLCAAERYLDDLFGAVLHFTAVRLRPRPMASGSGTGRERPADPVAQRLAHDELEVTALQPWQFLGEQNLLVSY